MPQPLVHLMQTALRWLKAGGPRLDRQRVLALLSPLMLGFVAYVGAQSVSVINDAYSYVDEFNDNAGIDLGNSNGQVNTGGRLDASQATMTVVSNCFALPQPSGGAFQRWLFAEVGLSNLSSVTSSALQVEDCSGAVLLTRLNPSTGTTGIDLSTAVGSTPAIRLRYTATHSGTPGVGVTPARLEFWRAYGEATGATTVSVTPSATSVGHNAAVTMTLNVASNGAITRNAVLRLSFDDINGLAASGAAAAPDDGLNQDAEVDYGNGGGLQAYRSITLNNAGNAPNGSAPTSSMIGTNRGALSWNLGDLPSGYTGAVTVTLRVPIGMVNGRTFAARATVSHGATPVQSLPGLTTEQQASGTSPAVTVSGNSNWIQTSYSPYGNVGPGATGIWRDFRPYLSTYASSGMDAESARVTIDFNLGSCVPTYQSYAIQSPPPAAYTHRLISAPAAGAEATTPLVYHFDRLPWNSYGGGSTPVRVTPTFNVPATCADGSTITMRMTTVYGNPSKTVVNTYSHPVVVNYCRAAGSSWVHRQANGPTQTWSPWPAWTEYYINSGSVRPGEYFSTWLYGNDSNASHTVTLNRSYYLVTVPSWLTFHGLTAVNNTSRIYKDSTGTAPLPNDPSFVHTANPPHPGWRTVSAADIGTSPFSATPNDSNPTAVVAAGTRLLFVRENDHPRTTGPSFGNFSPEALWRVADGSFGVPAQTPASTNTNFLPGRVYTWETLSNPLGVARDCGNFNSNATLTNEQASWPVVRMNFNGNPNIPAGQTAVLNLYPENRKFGSAPVDGTWVFNLFAIRNSVNLAAVTGSVVTSGRVWPPGANPAGIVFTPPQVAACLAAASDNDPACMARWTVPLETQPWPTYGEPDAGDADRDNVLRYPIFQLNLPILRNAAAGTSLPVTAEVRRADLSARGADNAVATSRHAASNYSAVGNIAVLESPELSTSLSAPSTWPHNSAYTAQLQLANNGNAPSQGFYTVLRTPRSGVGGSQFTPTYGRAFITQSGSDVLLETSTDSNCLANPLSGTWISQTLQGSTRSGYLAETASALPAATTCVRLRRNPAGSYTFSAGLSLGAAVDIGIPDNAALANQVLALRATSGSSTSLGSTAAFGPLETSDATTQVSSSVVTGGSKTAVPDLTRAGWVRWTLRWSNQSGAPANNVAVTDDIPTQLIYRGLANGLPTGTTCVDSGCAAVGASGDGSGGQLRLRVASLSANDGVAGSGTDEGSVDVWMERKSGIADGTVINNCMSTLPAGSGNVGSNGCFSTHSARVALTLSQTVIPAQGGSPPIVFPNDVVRYTLTLTNQETTERFLRIHAPLSASGAYVPGSFLVNGAAASDAAFSSNTLSFLSSNALAPGGSLTLQYDLRVNGAATNGTLVSHTATATACTNNTSVDSCGLGKQSSSVTAQVQATAAISGTVFEDLNYGGGSGRTLATSAGVPRPGARVELYGADGGFVAATTTNASGVYTFSGLGAADWFVRVTLSSVTSSRTGAAPSLSPVQTLRTAWNGSNHTADTARVGGENPALADAADNTTNAALSSLSTGGATPHSLTPVRTATGTQGGIDFGFNFNTVVNTNDSGAGSLRQAITNANALSGDASLAQAGRLPGMEHIVFMIGNGSSAAGLRAAHNFFATNGGDAMLATITLASLLPAVSTPMAIDAQLQPGWSSGNPRPVIELNGAFSAGNTGAHGITLSGSGSAARGLVINGFGGRQIHVTGGSNVVQGNWLGLNASGTGPPPTNGIHGLSMQSAFNVIGGNTAALRNVASGNNAGGIVIETANATGNLVIGNYVGTNAAGTAAVPNQQGIWLALSASGNTIGGAGAGEGNLASGNTEHGVLFQGGASANVVIGNRIGTNAAGTAAIRNQLRGVFVEGSNNNTIGGSAAGQGNLISGNGRTAAEGWWESNAGVLVNNAATGIVIAGNTIGLATDGSSALPNSKNAIFITGSSQVVVGGPTAAHRNLIAGNASHGVYVSSNGSAGVTVQNNWIGLAADGATARANGTDGVVCFGGTVNNCVVTGNVIAQSSRYGLWLATGTGHVARGNYIGTDSTGTLARPNGAGGVYVSGTGTSVTIGGTSAADRNVISGNGAFGIRMDAGSTGTVQGNHVGTNAAGTAALGNNGPALWLNGAAGVTVGGSASGAGNVLAASTGGFGNGLRVELATATGNVIQGNLIGSNATNTADLGNAQSGVAFVAGASDNTFGGRAAGQANVLRASGLRGVGFDNTGGVPLRNRISGNSIFGNALIGIGRGSTPAANDGAVNAGQANNGIDSPVLTAASLRVAGATTTLTVAGYVGTAPGQTTFGGASVEFFASDNDSSGFGEGQTYLGTLTADANGNFSGTVTVPAGVALTPGSTPITATAIDANGNTSEFGANFVLLQSINGTVFEDVNYGGGPGRSLASSAGVPLASATVELYAASGALVATTVTGSDGYYSFDGVPKGGYLVRIVQASVRSSRSGSVSGLLPVQTWRYESSWLAPAAVTNEVGGARPEVVDTVAAPALTWSHCADEHGSANFCAFTGTRIVRYGVDTRWTVRVATGGVSCSNGVFGDPAYGTQKSCQLLDPHFHSASSVHLSAGNAAGVDFGFNFNTVTNVNDSGAGSLRQAITNANALGDDASLAVAGRAAGIEHLVFMISNGSTGGGGSLNMPAGGLRGSLNLYTGSTARITLGTTTLPALATPIVINAQAQPGWVLNPVVELVGDAVTSTQTALRPQAGNTTVRGFIIRGFVGRGVDTSGPGGNTIAGNWIGLDATGALATPTGNYGIYIDSPGDTVGGSSAADRNVVGGYDNHGIRVYTNGSGTRLLGNYVGLDPTGTAARANAFGITLYEAQNVQVGGAAAGEGNLLSGNTNDGLYVQGPASPLTMGTLVRGNRMGTNAAGTAAVPNGRYGAYLLWTSHGNRVGGTAAGEGNLISGNTSFGLRIDSSDNTVQGNLIGTNAAGTAALGNGANGVYIEGAGVNTALRNLVGGTSAAARNLISGNGQDGVYLSGAGVQDNDIQGNYIGTSITGATALPNGRYGVYLVTDVTNNRVGGAATGAGNVISGNADFGVRIASTSPNNWVQGNLIGLNAAGTAAVPNGTHGVHVAAAGTLIGGTAAGAGNTISGNVLDGVYLVSVSNVTVQGNRIGTNASGTAAVGNGRYGIYAVTSGGNHLIGGAASGASNVVSGNVSDGIRLQNQNACQVLGNRVGTNAGGTAAVANGGRGVALVHSTSTTVGGNATGAGNLLSGNALDGLYIAESGTDGTVVHGNLVGTAADGTSALPNQRYGVYIANDARNTTLGGVGVGDGNSIAHNLSLGVRVHGSGTAVASGHRIRGNRMWGNAGIGIDLTPASTLGVTANDGTKTANAPNELMDSPVLTRAVLGSNTLSVVGYVGSAALQNTFGGALVDLYVSSGGQGRTYVGTVTANVDGEFAGVLSTAGISGLVVGSTAIVSTATDASGNTSEFGNEQTTVALGPLSNGGFESGTNPGAGFTTLRTGDASAMGGWVVTGRSVDYIGGLWVPAEGSRSLDLSGDTRGGVAQVVQTIPGQQYTVSYAYAGNMGCQPTVKNLRVTAVTSGGSTTQVNTFDVTGNHFAAMGWVDRNLPFTATAEATVIWFEGLDWSCGGSTLDHVRLSTGPPPTANLSGTVFEDLNYGGGAGRPRVSASGNSPRPGARVELYDASGNFVTSTTTNASGNYSFTGRAQGNYTVRVVSSSVSSSRSGWSASAVPTVVYRSDATNSSAIPDANFVGGANPLLTDAGNGSTTLAALTSASATAQAITPVTLAGDITGLDFGFSFNVVTHTRDTGSGSLRQAITNANTLGGDNSLAQAGRATGMEHIVFMLPNSAAGNGLRSAFNAFTTSAGSYTVATLTPASALPNVTTPMVLDAQTQPGWTLEPRIEISGSGMGTASRAIEFANGSAGSRLAGFIINRVASGMAVYVSTGATGVVIQGNWLGVDAAGAAAAPNGASNVVLAAAGAAALNATVGGSTAAQRNVISGSAVHGVLLESSGNTVTGNYIGTNAAGTAAIGNSSGVRIRVGASNNTIGGSAAGAGNLISGNGDKGVWLSETTSVNNVVAGNTIGLNAAGTAALPNANSGVNVGGAVGTVIGGTTADHGNLIAGNGSAGVALTTHIGSTASTTVRFNTIGLDAAGTARPNSVGILIDAGSGGHTIADNTISGNTGHGIQASVAGAGSSITGNRIGTTADGTAARGNGATGVYMAGTASGYSLGGTAAGAGNLISGNALHGVHLVAGATGISVQGNLIGTNAAGTAALPNATQGVLVDASGITIGGTAAGARNLISGNGQAGVRINGSNVVVQGNYIGTNAAGTAAVANGAPGAGNGGVWLANGPGALIGGSSAAARNVISGNGGAGVWVDSAGASGAVIQGNHIGTNAAGDAAISNGRWGMVINGSGVQVGGTAAGAGNLISGNSAGNAGGIYIQGSSNVIEGNRIGTNAAGTGFIANGNVGGVEVRSGNNNRVGGTAAGAGNVVAGNNGVGVALNTGAMENAVLGNSIHGNTGIGIDVGGGVGGSHPGVTANDGATTAGASNLLMDHPVFTAAALAGGELFISGYMGTAPNDADFANARVEVFVADNDASGFGEGQAYLGFLTADASGNFSGRLTVPVGVTLTPGTTRVTGTATDTANNTSEFGANFTVTAGISGRVFEDVNYGGGAGRDWTTASANAAVARPNVRVEYGIVSGGVATMQGFVTTAADGSYIVPTTGAGQFAVRVPTAGVSSSRTGYAAGLLPVLTYFADAASGTLTPRANFVGGRNPTAADAPEAAPGATVDTSTGVFTSGVNGTAQASAWVQVSASAGIGGIDFGFNFATVVNTNDSGAGSLRQVLTNANTLGGDTGLAVAGRTAGIEHVVFMLGNGSSAPGLRSSSNLFTTAGSGGNTVATINASSALDITASLVVDAQTQPGWTLDPRIEIRGDGIAASFNGLLQLSGGGTTVRGLIINRHLGEGIRANGEASGHVIQGCWIGVAADGTTAAPIRNSSIWLSGTGNNHQIGGLTAAARNVLSGTTVFEGLAIAGGRGHVVQGNHIGTDRTGSTAIPTQSWGIKLYPGVTDSVIGGTAIGAGNVISGSQAQHGIYLMGSGITVQGNRIGTTASGTAAIGNAAGGILIEGSNHVIGGTTVEARNLISGNGGHGIRVSGSGHIIQGNFIGVNAAGTAALGNAVSGVWLSTTATGNTVGGTATGAGNLISGHAGWYGIEISGASNTVLGNTIGLNVSGSAALPNNRGIWIAAAGATVGGSATGARNVISGNTNDGIYITGGGDNATVQGNFIGTDLSGLVARPNGRFGIIATNGAANPRIGGTVAGSGNLISGNTGTGLVIATYGTVVEGNVIGRNLTHTANLANGGHGVSVGTSYPASTTIGGITSTSANVIAGNVGHGVQVHSSGTSAAILGNSIFGNGSLGIDLVGSSEPIHGVTANDGVKTTNQPNQLMDSPVFTSARARGNQLTVAGYVGNTAALSAFANARVEIFASDSDASGFGEGPTYLGFVTTDASGNFSSTITMTAAVLKVGTVLTGTATDTSGKTSEFGANFANLIVDLVINDKGDAVDANPGDGFCGTAGGVCTLRAAIAEFNALPAQPGGTPTLAFALPGCSAAGQAACSIAPASALPTSSRPTMIDGQTQPGWTQSPIITLTGTSAGSASGLRLAATGTGVRGLIIQRFSGFGVDVQSAAAGAVLQGNWVGVDAAGSAAGNSSGGIQVAASGVLIGGALATDRNILSSNGSSGLALLGSATGTVIQGNWFGLAPDGVTPRGNGAHGIRSRDGSSATIGGTLPGQGNLFAASAQDGLALEGAGGSIFGNVFGLGADGSTRVPIGRHAIYVMTGTWVVGGTGANEPNILVGNGGRGILVNNGAKVTISANSIREHGQLGIDLGHVGAVNSGVGNGITANDGLTDSAQANQGMDMPVLNGVGIADNGAAMTISGYVGTGTGQAVFAGSRIEIFKAAADPSGYGEGQVYLGTLTADGNGRFTGTFAITPGSAIVGDSITATATDTAGNTSEFSANWTSTTMAGLAPAGFNAFEPDTVAGSLTGVLRSRVAGNASNVDIVALDSSGTGVHSGLTGSVTLSWLDARDDAGSVSGSCRSSWVDLGNAGTATFTANARVSVAVTPPASGTRVMRLKMVFNGPAGVVTSCSSDAFAALPAQLQWGAGGGSAGATDADSGTAGTTRALTNENASGGVVHRAGRPFTLRARALDATGTLMTAYDGSPVLSIASCSLPATGCVPGTLGGGQVSATAGLYTHNSVSYSEVGAIQVRLTDLSYASIDAADTPLATRTLVSADQPVGRFVPDAYTLNLSRSGRLATGQVSCMAAGGASTFYGQGFGWSTTPQLTVTAVNAAGTPTLMWSGALMKLGSSGWTPALAASGAGSATLATSFGTVTVTALGAGLARVDTDAADRFILDVPAGTQQTTRTPGWTYGITLTDTSEAAAAGNPTLSVSTSDGSVNFPDGGSFHSGRLSLAAAFGDARSGVRALVQLQRWTDAGWVTMTEDRGCVTIAPQNLGIEAPSGVFASAGLCAAPMGSAVTTRGGRAWIPLPATPGGATGRVTLRLAGAGATGSSCVAGAAASVVPLSMPWLLGGSGSAGPGNLATWGSPLREPTLRREIW